MEAKQIFNTALSEKASECIDAQPKQCWTNAYRALIKLPELKKAKYVEGWIVRKAIPLPFEHGWLELGNEIIDPTRVLWKSDEGVSYFPGIVLSLPNMKRHIKKSTQLPIFRMFGNGGLSFPPYLEAYKKALQTCGAPAKKVKAFFKGIEKKDLTLPVE